MDLGYAKRIFITAKKSESVTISTLETYERGLKRFFDYLIEQDVLDLNKVDSGIIREFLISLRAKGLKGITTHQYFSFNCFFKINYAKFNVLCWSALSKAFSIFCTGYVFSSNKTLTSILSLSSGYRRRVNESIKGITSEQYEEIIKKHSVLGGPL